MTRWLFAAELGGGLGHCSRLGEIARTLVQPRDTVIVAASDVAAAQSQFSALNPTCIEVSAPPVRDIESDGGYSGVLNSFSYDRVAALKSACQAWDAIFETHKPDAVIADHAPFAVFAAREKIPCAVIGGGFDLPPTHQARFPPFHPRAPVVLEHGIVRAMRRVAVQRGLSPPAHAPAALHGDYRALAALPWLDPYEGRRVEKHLGPVGRRPPLTPPPATGHLFAYLRAELPGFEAMVIALADLPMRRTAYIQGASGSGGLLAARGVEVLTSPADLTELLPQASIVLGHGGAGISSAAIYAGRVVVSVPAFREAGFNGMALDRLGMGRTVYAGGASTIYWAVMQACEDLGLRDRALRAGRAAHARFPDDPVPEIAAGIRKMLDKAHPHR